MGACCWAGIQGITLLNPLILLCDPDGASGGRVCVRPGTVSVGVYVSLCSQSV